MDNNVMLKQELIDLCQSFIDERLRIIQNVIKEVQESMNSETKSTAGDKHETGRAMLQLEREKAGRQLAEVEKLNLLLSKVDIAKSSEVIGLGSVVLTTQANYFIAVSAGQLKTQNNQFFAISLNTPIAQLLLGKKTGDHIVFREQHFEILQVI